MQQAYLKKLTKQDITRSVTICSESVESFWGIPLDSANEYVPIKICNSNNPSIFPNGITIHKGYQGIKDWRICGSELKSLFKYGDNKQARIGDIMLVRKTKDNAFFLEIIESESDKYKGVECFLISNDNYTIINVDNDDEETYLSPTLSLQQIFYGAPGTGKSHGIKEKEKNFSKVIRTTFHPDSDYSTFVGAYKPTMEESEVKVTPVVINNGISLDQNNGTYKEKRITYTFVKQAFLKAYIEAWKQHVKGENVLLVIEEINRGNCAQIFGDLFQLLDRNDEGYSDYPIQADEDIRKVLADEFVNLENIPENVKSGEELLLPNNLYIWATMNTSDQSLFPIDSAFKRRWNWKYVKIKDGKKNWKIDIKLDDENVDWWAFIQKINAIIASMTSSADKQLGYFFCKADKDGVISAETFVSKVIFYLWNDVFKDYGFEDASLFRYKVKEGEKEVEKDLTFPDFYDEDGETVNAERLADFIRKVMNWQNREGNI